MSKKYVCARCEHVGTAPSRVKGSLLVEVVLWLCLLLPGLIYTVWRHGSRRPVCGKCGSEDLLSPSSPRGKKMLAESLGPERAEEIARADETAGIDGLLKVAIFVAVLCTPVVIVNECSGGGSSAAVTEKK